jgi:hypothetical protein
MAEHDMKGGRHGAAVAGRGRHGVAELLALALTSLGHQTVIAEDGAAGLTRAAASGFDVMLLDVMIRRPWLSSCRLTLPHKGLWGGRSDAAAAHVAAFRL